MNNHVFISTDKSYKILLVSLDCESDTGDQLYFTLYLN